MLAAPCPQTWSRGATANDKNPAGPGREALGRSRGGLSTKIHLAADRRCRPVSRILSAGQHGDCPRFIPLLEAIRISRRGLGRPVPGPVSRWVIRRTPRRPNRAYLRKRGIKAVIPVMDDRCFGKLKQRRAVATRYDKREFMYKGTVALASIRIGPRDPAL